MNSKDSMFITDSDVAVVAPPNPALSAVSPTTPEEALAVIETLTPAKLFEPGSMDPILDNIKARVRSVHTDVSTDAGRKAVASLAFKVARSKTFIDNQRKALVSDEKKRLAAIDKEGKRIWDELESLQHEVRKPLTEWEQAEKARVDSLESAIAEISAAGPYTFQNWLTLTVEAMQDRCAEIENDNRDWQEFSNRAALAKKEAVSAIKMAIEKRKAYDEQQAELERLRKEAAEREERDRQERLERERREREERIAQQAREEEVSRAQRERERLEREKRDAEEARIRAEERAKAAAEEAIRQERERAEREKKATEEAEAKREANKRHVAKINRESLAALVAAGIDEATGKKVIELIAKGEVPNVRITY